MIVDIGGGTSEVGIISFGGVVASRSVRIGGDHIDEEIIQYIKRHFNVLIGESTAEKIKIEIGHALIEHDEKTMDVRGRDLVTGLPKVIEIKSTEVQYAIKEVLEAILNSIRDTLENCPPELSGDIVDQGITLTGGGALLQGMEKWLSKVINVPVHLAPNPLESVAIGTGRSLKMIQKLQKAAK